MKHSKVQLSSKISLFHLSASNFSYLRHIIQKIESRQAQPKRQKVTSL
jgi:hypothetical protein